MLKAMQRMLLVLSVIFAASTGLAKEPPNVIVIMTDDQGYGDLSCTGNPVLKTPNLDKLCAQGVHFTDFHVSPYCTPTRASLMTGRDARRTCAWHTYGGRNLMAEEEVTMADIFKSNGYATGHFGKWHLGINYPFAPHYRGFDTSLMLGNGGMGASDDYWDNDRFDDTYFLNGKPVKTKGYGIDVFVDHALNFIEQHKDEPFFVYLAPNIPHRPWNVPAKYSRPHNGGRAKKQEVVPYSHTDMSMFYGCIDKIDEQVGRVLRCLEDEDLDKNTIVIFLTDNGTVSTGYNAGMRGRKGSPYEGGHRVPLFIRWPGGNVQSEHKVRALSAHVDILPTLVDLCGLNTETPISFDGRSLAPLLRNDPTAWDDNRVYIAQTTQSVKGGYHVTAPKWGRTAVCKKQWRLVEDELYDVQADPGQKNDLAASHPGIVSELKEAYEEYWQEIQPDTQRVPRIRLGNPKQKVTALTHMNLTPIQGGRISWSQDSVVNAYVAAGKWSVYVEQPGPYEVELRRWPIGVDRAIGDYKGLGGACSDAQIQKRCRADIPRQCPGKNPAA